MRDDAAALLPIITPEEAARLLTIPVHEVVQQAREGLLPGRRYGQHDTDWRFSRPVLEALVDL